MKNTARNNEFFLDPDARSFIKTMGTFGVGVGVGLAPFFGEIPVPGFRSLIHIFPEELRGELFSLAPLLMGTVAAVVKFQLGEKIYFEKLRHWRTASCIGVAIGLLTLIYIHNSFVVPVRTWEGERLTIIGNTRLPSCDCPSEIPDDVCITRTESLDRCWNRKDIQFAFKISYLLTNLSFGVLVCALMLQKKAKEQSHEPEKQSSEPSSESSPGLVSTSAGADARGKADGFGVAAQNMSDLQPVGVARPEPCSLQIEDCYSPSEGRGLSADRTLEMKSMDFDVFLSHRTADKPAVEELGHRLEAAGIRCWLDKWNLVPGEPWQEAIEDALDRCATCAIFVGSGGISPWENEEMRAALERRVEEGKSGAGGLPGFRVIPVLLPGAPADSSLPRFLRRLTWARFDKSLDDDDAFHRLLSGIRGVAPRSGHNLR